MKRAGERKLVTVMGIWQIIDGLLTIIYYGFYQHGIFNGGAGAGGIDKTFTLICSFGTLLLGLGIINLVIAKNYIKDNQVMKKMGGWFIAEGILSYFVMDIPSLVLAMATAVLMLAKNKSIRLSYQQS
ncbi:hypothetical protein M2139_002758 [Enterococcus sp. PF1-24]|uniref:hypothetical protein n=1 Tax=unclassified Enterococcus TaxID=2608891 RepID=UPI00247472C7|nr:MULTISPECIES: hypothetical protein [unclassified Enterococcus]MDH6365730.1 hypothetical protein [Enterococcus sp. PFB1-1]MDH6402829.1 hypothetical protein [Enterococcus sp. PF1-24]